MHMEIHDRCVPFLGKDLEHGVLCFLILFQLITLHMGTVSGWGLWGNLKSSWASMARSVLFWSSAFLCRCCTNASTLLMACRIIVQTLSVTHAETGVLKCTLAYCMNIFYVRLLHGVDNLWYTRSTERSLPWDSSPVYAFAISGWYSEWLAISHLYMR